MRVQPGCTLPPPSGKCIQKFEQYCRVILPGEYKQFLRQYNGAVPETYVFEHRGNEFVVERFLCLLDNCEDDDVNGWYDLSVVLTQLGERLTDNEDLIGAELIPIAALFAGDFLCLDYRNRTMPAMAVWYHEESGEFSPVTSQVADNFDDFIAMLRE
ncbi:SMI1/KNR4 family protein [Paenibacillus sp. y28]|uniref:SMI1/KNR4 family protein n=1 Tax=Paenibacillus sp. y28 TaxID=3129110 RepID=UPI0030161096